MNSSLVCPKIVSEFFLSKGIMCPEKQTVFRLWGTDKCPRTNQSQIKSIEFIANESPSQQREGNEVVAL